MPEKHSETSAILPRLDKLNSQKETNPDHVNLEFTKQQSARELIAELAADPRNGLNPEEAARRLREEGPNELEKDEAVPLWKIFVIQFRNLLILMLLAAGIAAFALEKTPEGVVILVMVLLNATIATYTEKSAASALAALGQLSQPMTTVIRNGTQRELFTHEVVRGDLVEIEVGDVVPADLRLVHSTDLKVNEMPLTGESIDVSKSTSKGSQVSETLTPIDHCFATTTVTAGWARGIVVATGMKTRVGQIATMLRGDSEEKRNCLGVVEQKQTPLQVKLHGLGIYLSIIALSACVLVFVIGVARNYNDPAEDDDQPAAVQMVLVAVSLAVAVVPEGLPLCVTICLALGTKYMAKYNSALVRRLPAVETLGSAQVICSDKTGTLTEGKMTAVKLLTLQSDASASPGGGATIPGVGSVQFLNSDLVTRSIDITGKGLLPVGEFMDGASPLTVDPQSRVPKDLQVSTLLRAALLNSTAQLRVQEDSRDPTTMRDLSVEEIVDDNFATNALKRFWIGEGNSSEIPLVVAAAKAGIFEVHEDAAYPSVGVRSADKDAPEVPFSSERKTMMSVVHCDEGRFGELSIDNKLCSLVKGAPNQVLEDCAFALLPDGTQKRLTPKDHELITSAVDDLSSQALRVLVVAMKPLDNLGYNPVDPNVSVEDKAKVLGSNLVFLGLIASVDPEREGVADAVETAREAGVRTVMITGDYLKTAVAIARLTRILPNDVPDENVAVDCSALRPNGDYLVDDAIDEMTARCVVFARAKPEDKLRIVQSLQRQKFVTSMTGDGVNDAPALNEADIGVAMGMAGTEVAKGASDLILLDDNFTTIVSAIATGRRIYANIQKFVTYLLGTNLAEVLLVLAAVSAGLPSPLGALAILFLNIAIDSVPAMAMSIQSADDGIMNQPPRDRNHGLLTKTAWIKVIGHAVWVATTTCACFVIGMDSFIGEGLVTFEKIAPGRRTITECSIRQADGSRESISSATCAEDGIKLARTMAFITIVYAEVLRGFTVRTHMPVWSKLFDNGYLLGGMGISGAAATLLLLVPGLRGLLNFEGTELPWWAWLLALAFAFSSIIFDELVKYWIRNHQRIRDEKRYERKLLEDLRADVRTLMFNLSNVEHGLKAGLSMQNRAMSRPSIHESAQVLAAALEMHGFGPANRFAGPSSPHELYRASKRRHAYRRRRAGSVGAAFAPYASDSEAHPQSSSLHDAVPKSDTDVGDVV